MTGLNGGVLGGRSGPARATGMAIDLGGIDGSERSDQVAERVQRPAVGVAQHSSSQRRLQQLLFHASAPSLLWAASALRPVLATAGCEQRVYQSAAVRDAVTDRKHPVGGLAATPVCVADCAN